MALTLLCNQCQQLNLFGKDSPHYIKHIVTSPEDLKQAFLSEVESGLNRDDFHPWTAMLSPELASVIKAMAIFNHRKQLNTRRRTSRCDEINLIARVAGMILFDEDPKEFFGFWLRAIRSGHGGVQWESGNWRISLRSTLTKERLFTYVRNPKSFTLTHHVFATIDESDSGFYRVTYQGFVSARDLRLNARQRHDGWLVPLRKLIARAILRSMNELKSVLATVEGGQNGSH